MKNLQYSLKKNIFRKFFFNGSRSVRVVKFGSWVDLDWVLTQRVGLVNVYDE